MDIIEPNRRCLGLEPIQTKSQHVIYAMSHNHEEEGQRYGNLSITSKITVMHIM